jgi:hypothetical protein
MDKSSLIGHDLDVTKMVCPQGHPVDTPLEENPSLSALVQWQDDMVRSGKSPDEHQRFRFEGW